MYICFLFFLKKRQVQFVNIVLLLRNAPTSVTHLFPIVINNEHIKANGRVKTSTTRIVKNQKNKNKIVPLSAQNL